MQTTRGTSLTESGGSTAVVTRPRRVGLFAVIAAAVYLLDVTTKIVAVAVFTDRPPLSLLGGVLTLRLTRNPGAAFSIGVGATVVFSVVAVGVIVAILRTARRLRSAAWAAALGMVLGGALGNLTDRIARSPGVLRGHVVDWIELPHWPVFNVADSSIVAGAILLVLVSARGIGLDGERSGHGSR